MKKKEEIREEELKKLSEIVANWIGANSAVSDDWLNSIKTYYNAELTGSELTHLFLLMICMLIDLAIVRTSDLIQPKEKIILEKNIIEHIAYIQSWLMCNQCALTVLQHTSRGHATTSRTVATHEPQSLLNTEINQEERKEARDAFENSLYKLLEIYRTERQQQNISIPQVYLTYLLNGSEGQKLPEKVWISYIDNYVKAFEERNFRKQLNDLLNKLPA